MAGGFWLQEINAETKSRVQKVFLGVTFVKSKEKREDEAGGAVSCHAALTKCLPAPGGAQEQRLSVKGVAFGWKWLGPCSTVLLHRWLPHLKNSTTLTQKLRWIQGVNKEAISWTTSFLERVSVWQISMFGTHGLHLYWLHRWLWMC